MREPTEQDKADDYTGPIFWETVHWMAKQGKDIVPQGLFVPWNLGSYRDCKPMEVELSAPTSITQQIRDLERAVAIKTDTQLMPVITQTALERYVPTIFAEWADLNDAA